MTGRQFSGSFLAAALIMLTAIALYDTMGAIIKHLSAEYRAQQLAFFRNLFGLVPAVALLYCAKSWTQAGRPFYIRRWKLALLRGLIGVAAQMCFYVSLLYMEFATATSILFAGPLIITALSIPILRHRIGLWRWLAVLVGFVGVLMVIRPPSDSLTWHSVLPLGAALGYATISVTARLFDESIPTALINLYQNLGALACALILVIATGGFAPIGAMTDWLWLAAVGTAGGVAAFCMTTAYRLTEPSSLSPFEYFGIPFSFIIGWVFFAEAPFDRLIPGVFLIVGGGLMIAWRERLLKKKGQIR
ncbi:MAG: DMT family transporter [Pseudomonadota bacterium]